MIESLNDIIENKKSTADTSLANSIESHLMYIEAEKSRLKGGKMLKVHK